MTRPSVLIVIVNYNGRDLLEKYFPSVQNLNYENYQTVVVDNDSLDGSIDLLEQEFPEVTVVENEENAGLSKGNNAGVIAGADSDYLWFLNPDVRVTESSLSVLVEYMEQNPDMGITVPRINEMDSETIQSLGYHYDVTGRCYRRHEGKSTSSIVESEEVPCGMLAALLVDSTVWDDIGGFDEENFIYGDDDYLCLQAWLRGYHVEIVPESVVYHEGGASKAPSEFDVYHNARNRTRCYLKTLQLRSIALGFPFYVGRLGVQMGKDLVVRRSPEVASSRFAGLANAVSQLPSLYRERKEHQREREYPDSRFLSSVFSE